MKLSHSCSSSLGCLQRLEEVEEAGVLCLELVEARAVVVWLLLAAAVAAARC